MNRAPRAWIAILACAATFASTALFAAAQPAASSPEAPRRGASERARLSIEPAGHAFTHVAIENPLGDVKGEGYDGTAIQI